MTYRPLTLSCSRYRTFICKQNFNFPETRNQSKMAQSFMIPGDFGYVILTSVASIFIIMWKGFKVGAARRKYEVPVSGNRRVYFFRYPMLDDLARLINLKMCQFYAVESCFVVLLVQC